MSIRLDEIDYFHAVVRHGQMRPAAAELGVTQPAVTQGIQRLERKLGFPLFERSSRGMTLTAVAQQFYERTRLVRSNLSHAIKEAADLHLGAIGVLRVGVSPLYAQRLFVPACLRLHQQRPAARLVVNINFNDVLLAALHRGDIDLGINALPATVPASLQARPLLADDLCIVVRPQHPLLQRRHLKLADLADAQWLLPGPEVAARRRIEALFSRAGLPPPRVAVEVSHSAAQMTPLLAHSDLLSLASDFQLSGQAGHHLTALPLAEARFPRQIGILTRKEAPLSPLAQRFVEVLLESVR